MPTELLDFEHELLADGEAAGLVFGRAADFTGRTAYFTTEYPQITPGDGRYGDVDPDREDGTVFGEDYDGGDTVTFELGVAAWGTDDPHVAGEDALGRLKSTWRARKFRASTPAYAVLRSRAVPGRIRRAYGRPRRYADTTSRLTHRGYSTVVCDFATRDGKWYDDEAQSVVCKYVPSPTAGFTTPLTTPLTTEVGGSTLASMTVAGDEPTWPVITLHAPGGWSQPRVTIGDLTLGFDADLPAGAAVTFDPRPWVRTVLRNDGASYAGKMTWETPPLPDCMLEPGVYVVGLAGNDPTGTAWAQVEWRNAHSRW